MSSSVSTTVGGVVVVTHVHPVPQAGERQQCVGIHKFSKGHPLVLGMIQIMVGLMVLLFGITMSIEPETLGVFSGIFVWGALFYIIAGSLTVAAGKYLDRCLVNGALGVSVVAAVASFTGTILYALDAVGIIIRCYDSSSWDNICYVYQTRVEGFSGVLALFSFLEFIVSLTIAGFACRATCNCCETPSFVVETVEASVTPPSVLAPPHPAAQLPSQVVSYTKSPEQPTGQSEPVTEPPAYTVVVS